MKVIYRNNCQQQLVRECIKQQDKKFSAKKSIRYFDCFMILSMTTTPGGGGGGGEGLVSNFFWKCAPILYQKIQNPNSLEI